MNHILIVEDDAEFRDLLAAKWTELQWQVTTAGSVRDAEYALSGGVVFSHCLLDLNLNTQNGLTLMPQILSLNPGCKIVILTGYASVHSGIEAVKLGAVYLLQKPSRFQDIVAAFDHTAQPDTVRLDEHAITGIAGIERELIQRTLADNQFNVTKTAEQLGLHRRTLQRKMKRRLG